MRDLVGHASRSLTTVETYLATTAPDCATPVDSAVDYYRAVATVLAAPEAIAERGRQAGVALGDDPPSHIAELVGRVTALVAATPDDAPVATAFGPMRLVDYLPTRTFELVVHTLDLATAVGGAQPAGIAEPVRGCIVLAAEIAGFTDDPGALLLALTGRRSLPSGFSVV